MNNLRQAFLLFCGSPVVFTFFNTWCRKNSFIIVHFLSSPATSTAVIFQALVDMLPLSYTASSCSPTTATGMGYISIKNDQQYCMLVKHTSEFKLIMYNYLKTQGHKFSGAQYWKKTATNHLVGTIMDKHIESYGLTEKMTFHLQKISCRCQKISYKDKHALFTVPFCSFTVNNHLCMS